MLFQFRASMSTVSAPREIIATGKKQDSNTANLPNMPGTMHATFRQAMPSCRQYCRLTLPADSAIIIRAFAR